MNVSKVSIVLAAASGMRSTGTLCQCCGRLAPWECTQAASTTSASVRVVSALLNLCVSQESQSHTEPPEVQRECRGRAVEPTSSANGAGHTLLSGSDDTRLGIWDVETRQLRSALRTGHHANIFCTRYMPGTGACITPLCTQQRSLHLWQR